MLFSITEFIATEFTAKRYSQKGKSFSVLTPVKPKLYAELKYQIFKMVLVLIYENFIMNCETF